MVRRDQAAKYRPLLKAINAGVKGFSVGGTAGGDWPIPQVPWASTSQLHNEQWQDQQTQAARNVERAEDRIEDLKNSVEDYNETLGDTANKLADNSLQDSERAKLTKEYNREQQELKRATRDLAEAQEDLGTAQRKQVEAAQKLPAGDKSGGDAQQAGGALIKGLFQELGIPDVFGEAFTNWGIWKMGMGAAGDILAPLLGGRGGPRGAASGLPRLRLPTGDDRGGIYIGPPGTSGVPQYGVPQKDGVPSLQLHPPAAGPAPQGGQPPAIRDPWHFDPHAATSGYGGGRGGTARAIYEAVTGAGYSHETGLAAVAAAQSESSLNPDSTNASGQESADKPSAGIQQQVDWFVGRLAALGGPSVVDADPTNTIANKVEIGGYPGSNYDLGAAANLLGGGGTFQPAGNYSGTPGFTPQPYGLPKGTDIRQGAPGFPSWVYDLGNRFGLDPSTYAGHQEGSGQNRGIDWFPHGHADMSGASYTPEETARLQNFAEYMQGVMPTVDPQGQTIFQNHLTGQKFGVAPGQGIDSSGRYYADERSQPGQGYGGHQGHVHTRFNVSEPIPGQAAPQDWAPPDYSPGGQAQPAAFGLDWALSEPDRARAQIAQDVPDTPPAYFGALGVGGIPFLSDKLVGGLAGALGAQNAANYQANRPGAPRPPSDVAQKMQRTTKDDALGNAPGSTAHSVNFNFAGNNMFTSEKAFQKNVAKALPVATRTAALSGGKVK